MHKFEVIIYWSNQDGVFVAEVPELPGCAAHGDTQEAALEHISAGHGPVAGNGAGVRRPDPRTKG